MECPVAHDAYGFVIEDCVVSGSDPSTAASSIASSPQPPSLAAIKSQQQRDVRWSRFLSEVAGTVPYVQVFPTFSPRSISRFDLLVTSGLPVAFRQSVWQACLSQRCPSLASSCSASAYKHLTSDSSLSLIPAETMLDITKDLDRTYPGHALFDSPAGVASLRRVLSAFASGQPSIGYCQSLNFIAGALLLFFDECAAYQTLSGIALNLLPPNYFDRRLTGLQVDQRVLKHLVGVLLPKVHKQFTALNFDLQIISSQWFLALFLNQLPFESVFRIWDVIICRGCLPPPQPSQSTIDAISPSPLSRLCGGGPSPYLFRVALSFLSHAQDEILKASTFGECFRAVQACAKDKGRRDTPDKIIADADAVKLKPFGGLLGGEDRLDGEVRRLREMYTKKVEEEYCARRMGRESAETDDDDDHEDGDADDEDDEDDDGNNNNNVGSGGERGYGYEGKQNVRTEDEDWVLAEGDSKL